MTRPDPPAGTCTPQLRADDAAAHWRTLAGLADYAATVAAMEARADAIRADRVPEAVWLLEHPPLYTAGTSADDADLIDAGGLPVFRSGRGGQFTWHGPGQRVAYVMLDLAARGRDVRCFVNALEEWVIRALAELDVTGERRAGRVGVWVAPPHAPAEVKIAAIGVRIRRWVSFHGIAINVCPDLSHYDGIVPCGLNGFGVTSLAALGVSATMADLDAALLATFPPLFGAVGP